MSDAIKEAAEAAAALSEPPSWPRLALPEIQWTWRRGYTYALTALALTFAGFLCSRISDPFHLFIIVLVLLALVFYLVTIYVGGGVVTDLARLSSIFGSAVTAIFQRRP